MKEERAARIYDGSDRLIFGELNNYQLFNAFLGFCLHNSALGVVHIMLDERAVEAACAGV
jgi:hypothetical protein